MSARAMRQAWLVFLLSIALLALVAYGSYRYVVGFPTRAKELPGQPVTLVVPSGATFPQVVQRLHERGLISNQMAFRLYVQLRGASSRIRAGTYDFNSSITPRELVDSLVKGVPAPTVKVTIPEGSNLIELARILDKAEVASQDALLTVARDPAVARRLGIPGDTLEGFLFPDTYRMQKTSDPGQVIGLLVRRHKQVFYALRSKYARRVRWFRKALGWGHREIVTLASIVEKETGKPEERPLVASVFLNRLTLEHFQPKLLQTDPTIIYGCTALGQRSPACQRFSGRIRRIHLRDSANPYNTYVHPGLPPSPIGNPGEAAIEAVFAPRRSRYLYFVSKNDGTHEFSATRAEHERAVDRYQRNAGTGSTQ